MAKHAKIFGEVNFENDIIKQFIAKQVEYNGLTDESVTNAFALVTNRIVQELIPEFNKLMYSPEYKYVQVRLVGLKEKPSNFLEVEVTEDANLNIPNTVFKQVEEE